MIATGRPETDTPRSSPGGDDRRARVWVIAAIFGSVALVLIVRLAYLQVVQYPHFQTEATAEHWRTTSLLPRRGDILDAEGNPLATTVEYASLYASTSEVASPVKDAAALAPILGQSAADLQAKLSKKQSAPILIQAWLPDDVAAKVNQLGLAGLFLQDEPKRAYPEGDLAAQVLGVVGVDDNGLSGLELQFDSDLAGKPGELVAERDTSGDAIALGPSLRQAPLDGSTLTLTIDRYVQWVSERELTAALAQHHAQGGTVIVLDPRTGGILAMASRPSFSPDDPNVFSPQDVALYGVPAISSAFEPGTLFQFVTMAGALDANVVTPTTTFLNSGTFEDVGVTVKESSSRPPGNETMADVLDSSSTVGSSWIAARLGAPKFYDTVQALGFGQLTAVDLPGEQSGMLRLSTDQTWAESDLASNSFGQGLAATPLQMASAMATIASGGNRFKPYVVEKVAGPGGAHLYYPSIADRAIRPEAAATLTRMLVGVVDDSAGEGHLARVPGFALAGKAGTADLPEPGVTSKTATVASFAGFGPAENPRFVIFVRIDAPTDSPSGETVAAPVFGAIARQLLNYYQIPPSRPVSGNGT